MDAKYIRSRKLFILTISSVIISARRSKRYVEEPSDNDCTVLSTVRNRHLFHIELWVSRLLLMWGECFHSFKAAVINIFMLTTDQMTTCNVKVIAQTDKPIETYRPALLFASVLLGQPLLTCCFGSLELRLHFYFRPQKQVNWQVNIAECSVAEESDIFFFLRWRPKRS